MCNNIWFLTQWKENANDKNFPRSVRWGVTLLFTTLSTTVTNGLLSNSARLPSDFFLRRIRSPLELIRNELSLLYDCQYFSHKTYETKQPFAEIRSLSSIASKMEFLGKSNAWTSCCFRNTEQFVWTSLFPKEEYFWGYDEETSYFYLDLHKAEIKFENFEKTATERSSITWTIPFGPCYMPTIYSFCI